MALEIMQGFDYSSVADLIAEGYPFGGTGTNGIGTGYARNTGGQGLLLDSTTAPIYLILRTASLATFTTSATKIIGISLNIQTALTTGALYIFGLVGTTTNASVKVNSNGSVSILNNAGTVMATSATGIITSATWGYVEVKSTGSQVAVAVNGTLACSATLTLGSINRADIGTGESTNTTGCKFWIDDLYALNSTSTPNDFLATTTNTPQVVTLKPTGAGDLTQWTPNTGTNYSAVGETTEDGDVSYVNAATVGLRDTYTHAALPSGISSIIAIDEVMYAKNDPASTGTHSVSQSIRIAGTDYDATAQTLAAGYATYHNLRTVSPATGTAFTLTEINGMQIGQRVAS